MGKIRPGIVFALWALWLTAEHWMLGDLSYLHMHDNADQLIPTYWWLTQGSDRLLGSGILPIMGGIDRLSVSASVHLFHMPFLFLPAWLANAVVLLFQRFMLGYFTYRFVHDVLKVDRLVAVLAGVAHTLVWVEHGEMRLMHAMNEAGFPLLLWALCTMSFERRRWVVWAAGYGVFFGLSMDPISATPFFLSTSLLCAWVVREDGRSRASALRLCGFAAIMLVFMVPFLWRNVAALVANAGNSHRGDWGHHNTFLHELVLLYRFAPGVLLRWSGAILLSLCFLLRRPWKTREGQLVLLLLFVAWIPGPLLKAGALQLREFLGVLNGFDWTRFDRVIPLAMLATAAMGLKSLRQGASSLLIPVFLLGMCFHVSLEQKAGHWEKMRLTGHNWRAVFGNHELQALADRTEQTVLPDRAVMAGAHHDLHPMFLLPYGLETLDGYAVLYPERWQQLWGDVVAGVLEGDSELLGHFNWGSRLYLYHSRHSWMSQLRTLPFDDWYDTRLLSLAGVRYVVSRTPLESRALRPVTPRVSEQDRLEWMGRSPWQKIKGYLRNENPGGRYYVYENDDALPRVFSPKTVETLKSWDALKEEMRALPFAELRERLLLAAEDQEGFDGTYAPLNITPVAYQPDRVVIDTSGTGEGVLVHSSQWYSSWECLIDGNPVALARAYGVFQAVKVPAGDHRIEFCYRPGYQRRGQE